MADHYSRRVIRSQASDEIGATVMTSPPSRDWEIMQRMQILIRLSVSGEATDKDRGELHDLQKERVRRLTPMHQQVAMR